jgi:hypothetical protein
METTLENAQKTSEKPKKRRSQEDKVGKRKYIIEMLKRIDARQIRIDRRTRMLAAGLRELFILGEDYVSMVACKDKIDTAILDALRHAGAIGRQTKELAAMLNIDHREIAPRIYRMNKKMEQEIDENIIEKRGNKWLLIRRLRRDFAAAATGEEKPDEEERTA